MKLLHTASVVALWLIAWAGLTMPDTAAATQVTTSCSGSIPGNLQAHAEQEGTYIGASAEYSFNQPYVSGITHVVGSTTSYDHSNLDLALQNATQNPTGTNAVEFVYAVDFGKYKDYKAHLLIGRWVNSQFTYITKVNGTTVTVISSDGATGDIYFKPGPGANHLGESFSPGEKHTLQILNGSTSPLDWNFYLDGVIVGTFSQNAWLNSSPATKFYSADGAQWFGEIFSNAVKYGGKPQLTAMGNGRWGTNPYAASVDNMQVFYIGANGNTYYKPATPTMCVSSGSNAYFTMNQTSTGFTYGGPGASSKAASVTMQTTSPANPAMWPGVFTSEITSISEADGTPTTLQMSSGSTWQPTLRTSFWYEPIAPTISPYNATAFVLGGLVNEITNTSVGDVFIISNDEVSQIITLPSNYGGSWSGILVSPDGSTLYVPAENEIYSYHNNNGTWAAGASITTGLSEIGTLAISSDGSKLFVLSSYGSNELVSIDTATNKVTATKQLSASDDFLNRIVMRPDQSGLYIVGSATVASIMWEHSQPYNLDTATFATIQTTESSTTTFSDIAFSPDSSRLYVLSYDGVQDCTGLSDTYQYSNVPTTCTPQIGVIDTATNKIIKQIPLPAFSVIPPSFMVTPMGLPSVAMAPDGATLFVAIPCTAYGTYQEYPPPWAPSYNCYQNTVYRVNTSTGHPTPTTLPTTPDPNSSTTPVFWGSNWAGGR